MYQQLLTIAINCVFAFNPINAQNIVISFENVNVIPMDKEIVLYNQRVVIKNGVISYIKSMEANPPKGITKTIDATDKFLLPSFSETHFHQQNDIKNEFNLLIANGITSARNMAEYSGQDHMHIKNQIKEGKYPSIDYYTAGPYLTRLHFKNRSSVDTIIQHHKEKGYDYLKIADNLPKDIYLKLLERAHQENIDVIGHGQRNLPLEFSLRMKSIAHIEEFMNILTDEEKRSDTSLSNFAKQVKTSGVYVSPTLGIFEMIIKYADNKKFESLKKSDNLKYLPKSYRDFWCSDEIHFRTKPWFIGEESLKRLNKELEWQKEITNLLYEEGVPLLAGSDTYGLFLPGFSLHHELKLINESGLSNYETLKTATVNPARYLGLFSVSGTIAEGKIANLVLLDKNPLEKIANTKEIFGVMLKGKWFDRNDLDYLLNSVENACK